MEGASVACLSSGGTMVGTFCREREREGAVVGHPTAVLPTGISHDLRSVVSIRYGRGWRTPTASPIADVLDSYLRGEVLPAPAV
jgi:hypothetical protein